MTDGRPQSRMLAGVREHVVRARTLLGESGARDEALAQYVAPRRVMLVQRKAAFAPLGRVWRLGVFLIGRDGALYATGSTTRAVPPGHPGYQSGSAEARRELRAAALRGPFAAGETVNFDARVIDLATADLRTATGPLFSDGDRALVRWNASTPDHAATEFGVYLAERVALLVEPPEGA